MVYFILSLEICSAVYFSNAFTTGTSAYSLMTSTAVMRRCSCSEVADAADKTQCVLDELFGTLVYYETSKCVSKEFTVAVRPWLKPIAKTVTSYYEGQIDSCQSGQSQNTPRLFINSSSPCGLFRCCIDCITCFDNTYNILRAEGPVILKGEMSDKISHANPDRLSLLCYQNDNYIALGEQAVYILFNKNVSCADMDDGEDSQLKNNTTSPNIGTLTTAKQSQTEALSKYYQDIINDQLMFPLMAVSAIALAFTVAGMAVNYYMLSRLHKSRQTAPR